MSSKKCNEHVKKLVFEIHDVAYTRNTTLFENIKYVYIV